MPHAPFFYVVLKLVPKRAVASAFDAYRAPNEYGRFIAASRSILRIRNSRS